MATHVLVKTKTVDPLEHNICSTKVLIDIDWVQCNSVTRTNWLLIITSVTLPIMYYAIYAIIYYLHRRIHFHEECSRGCSDRSNLQALDWYRVAGRHSNHHRTSPVYKSKILSVTGGATRLLTDTDLLTVLRKEQHTVTDRGRHQEQAVGFIDVSQSAIEINFTWSREIIKGRDRQAGSGGIQGSRMIIGKSASFSFEQSALSHCLLHQ